MKPLTLALCALLLIGLAPSLGRPPAQAQTGAAAGVRFDQQLALPGSAGTKFPQVAASAGAVHMAGNTGRLDASYWSRPAEAGGIAAPLRLGPALDQPDYSTASIAAGRDGRLYYAWINQPERAIYLRVRGLDGVWGATSTVQRGSPFPVGVQVGVAADGSIFVLWRDPDRPFTYSRSTDGGVRWSAPLPVSTGAGFNTPALATGANGSVAAAYTQGEGDRLQVYVGLWNGAGFQEQRISALSGDFADPSVAIAADGRLLAAWRGIADGGAGSGVHLAERRADGAWETRQIVAGLTLGRVNITLDESGGAHLTWIGMAAGVSQLWHAYRPLGGAWSAPVAAPASGGTIFNAHSAAGRSGAGTLYAHAVSEIFFGNQVSGQAYRFAVGGASIFARPVLEDGATHTSNASLRLTMADQVGDPREVRYRWGGPPTASDAWHSISAPLSVAVPAGAGERRCDSLTLYTQARGASGVQETAASVGIIVDRAVQVSLTPTNTYGAPGYTSDEWFELSLDQSAECGELMFRMTADSPFDHLSPAWRSIAAVIPQVEGTHEIAIEMLDSLGNRRWYRPTVVFDSVAPQVMGSPTLSITADPAATVLHRLTLSGVRYEDAGAERPWAAAVNVNRTQISADAPLQDWRVIPLDPNRVRVGADGSLTIQLDHSVANRFASDQLTPGRYYYLVRLVDPAGNRSLEVIAGAIDLEAVSLPRVYLPMLRR